MNTIIAEPYRSQLYTKVRHVLGAPIRSIELEDEQMDSILEFSIGDYSQYVQDWLIESQWTSLYNLNLDTQSLSRAFVTKSLDYENRYAQAYSKSPPIILLWILISCILNNISNADVMKYEPEPPI